MPRGSAKARSPDQQGFTFVWVLAAVALLSIGLSVVGPLWADQTRRDREQELLRIGKLYAQAIADYYTSTPGSLKQYPQRLDELLTDNRFWGTRRHLRKLYPDPMNPARPWGLVTDADGRIKGVYSQGDQQPFAQAPLDLGVTHLSVADHYADWHFVPDDMALKPRGTP